MTPQVQLDGRERIVEADSTLTPTHAAVATPRALTDAERQGLAMGWVSIALGMFLLFGGLALWAAIALNAGFVGWLVSMGIIGVAIAAVLVAVAYIVIRPRR
ncbi:MAG TPA: hypothetical protein VGR57_02600 [Ktedonobacterales bacterium]|nr:hypothetical protein [Ktedonobacterales bacterium]